MAKYRLKRAHYLDGDFYLNGDMENEHLGEEKGEIVGDGTPYVVHWPTLDMEPLDDEARAMIEKERERLVLDQGAMNPIENIPLNDYEKEYVPGSNQRRREMRPHGATVSRSA